MFKCPAIIQVENDTIGQTDARFRRVARSLGLEVCCDVMTFDKFFNRKPFSWLAPPSWLCRPFPYRVEKRQTEKRQSKTYDCYSFTEMTYKGVRFRQDAVDMIRNKPDELDRIKMAIDRWEQSDPKSLPCLYVRAGGTSLVIDDE